MAAGAITAAAGLAAFKKLVDDVYENAKGKVQTQLDQWRTGAQIQSAFNGLSSVTKVKTIWQVDKEVEIADFYYPTKVLVAEKRTRIEHIGQLDFPRIVLRGTAGQGKSVFMRFLTGRELFRGTLLPLFVELRRVATGDQLLPTLLREASALGVELSEETFTHFANSGKVALFLDGFDEVPEEARSGLVDAIEFLARRHEGMPILVSSRPGGGIETSSAFRVSDVCPLARGEYERVLERLVVDEVLVSSIKKAVRGNKAGVAGLLTTPLMVTLLVIAYRADNELPESLADFYERLFAVLLSRHDSVKPGFVRQRRTRLSDRNMRLAFDALCFQCKQLGPSEMTVAKVGARAVAACSKVGLGCDADDLLHDISSITCLLLEEGGLYHFIHKSVQEYHCACFIRSQPEASVGRFYEHARTQWFNWAQELEFLDDLDSYQFDRDFKLPAIERGLSNIDPDGIADVDAITDEHLLKLGSFLVLGTEGKGAYIYVDFKIGEMWVWRRLDDLVPTVFSAFDFDRVISSIFGRKKGSWPEKLGKSGRSRIAKAVRATQDRRRRMPEAAFEVSGDLIIKYGVKASEREAIMSLLRNALTKVLRDRERAEQDIALVESRSKDFEF